MEGLDTDPRALAIVRSIVALAEALDLSVTAEGVETTAQPAQLRALGCDRGQGYLFAKPLASNNLVDVLSRGCSVPLTVNGALPDLPVIDITDSPRSRA